MSTVTASAHDFWHACLRAREPATRKLALADLRAIQRNEALPASVRAAATTALREAGIGPLQMEVERAQL